VQARLDGADGDGEDAGDFFEGEVFEKVEGEGVALGEGELVEGVVDLFGVVEGDEGAIGGGRIGGGIAGVVGEEAVEAEAGDGGVAGGGVEEGG
jgi:hypothetical protein